MSFPSYENYKPSEIPWIGELPTSWEVTRLKNIFHLMKRNPSEDDGIVTAFRDGEVTLRSNRRTDGFTNAIHEHGYQRILKGDLVIHAMDAFAGAIGVSDSDGKSTPVYSVCSPKHESVVSRYYGRLLRHMALSGYINALAKGVRERSTEFRWSESSNISIPVPSFAEQIAITEFLDRETSKIDDLIAEQKRLIELLKEKRQAVISHAVTKGLSPDAPLKDSGIEWLGDVPEHWKVVRLKRVMKFVTSGSRGWAQHYSDNGELFLRIGNLTRGGIDLDLSDIQRVTVPDGSEGDRTRVMSGDVLFSVTAYLGSVAVIPDNLESSYVSQHVALVRLVREKVNPRWVGYAAISTIGKTWFDQQAYGGTKIQLSLDDVSNLPIPIPPISEQNALVAFTDHRLAEFESLVSDAEHAIELLQERRTALISAAVTGKIDVRECVSMEAVS